MEFDYVKAHETRDAGKDCLIFIEYSPNHCKTYIFYLYNEEMVKQIVQHLTPLIQQRIDLQMENNFAMGNKDYPRSNEIYPILNDIRTKIAATFSYLHGVAKYTGHPEELNTEEKDEILDKRAKYSEMDSNLLDMIKKGKIEYEELDSIITVNYQTTIIVVHNYFFV